ncbi:uncharacterized protein LOC132738051 [Ruditapes philippinarum]|uniref:uncharacterized protein LOC132738051 n=1 Tax=Ruditapes philippinarum TaxID=129788 RepID=UPI00295AAC4B|nr:uncharacterized protein LOC132738051 [Ruditapes philippinarum]
MLNRTALLIQCAVRVSSTPTGNQTDPQMSDTFYAGVKCKETAVTSLNNQKLCGSRLTGWRNTTTHSCVHQHNVNDCNYNRITQSLPTFSITITVSNDRLQYPEDKTFTLQLKTANIAPHQFWENASIDHVTVIYLGGSRNLEWKRRQCSVVNDPTLSTFDGPYEYIDSFAHYLMYRDKIHLTEVQIKTQKCDADHTASCTCAVAIQAGGDVFAFDIHVCNKVKRASFIHCRGNVLNVREIASDTYEWR